MLINIYCSGGLFMAGADFSIGSLGGNRGYDIKIQAAEISAQTEQPLPKADTANELIKAEQQGESLSISEEQVVKAMERAIKAMEGPYTTFDISIHEKTKQLMVKVLNKETGEVIREVPKEKTLDMVAKMMEMAGILIDERR
jgi:flagellar protein FlaG